jgi:inosose dehydratase
MSPSRRVFLAGLAGAGALVTAPRTVRASLAADPLNLLENLSLFGTPLHKGEPAIKLGCAAITWSDKAEIAIEDISADGYAGIQLRAPTLDQYPDPHTLRDLLAQKNLTFVALSSGSASVDPAQRQSQLEMHVKHAQYVHDAGGLYMQLTSATTRHGETFTPDQFKVQGEVFSEIGKRIAEYGVRLGFHNHMNTIGQPPEAVEAIIAASDPNYVSSAS